MTERVSLDDPELVKLLDVFDGLRDSEQRAIVVQAVRAALTTQRHGDGGQGTRFLSDLLAMLRLRAIPVYAQKITSEPLTIEAIFASVTPTQMN